MTYAPAEPAVDDTFGYAAPADPSGLYEADTDDRDDDRDEDSLAPEDRDDAGPDAATRARNQAKANRALYRRVAAKALEVNSADDRARALAASLVGSSEDAVELTAGIMSAPRSAQAALTDIDELTAALKDAPWEAGITATSMGRPRLRGVWSLLHTLGAVGAPTPPASESKAANALLKALNGLSDDSRAELAAAGELLKRS